MQYTTFINRFCSSTWFELITQVLLRVLLRDNTHPTTPDRSVVARSIIGCVFIGDYALRAES
jgi:hypothetical protein